MKVIITGATGFVGSSVLQRCIDDLAISEIVIISRRSLSSEELLDNAKVFLIVHDDFLHYPKSLLDRLAGAGGLIWCIGGRHTQTSRWSTHEEYVRVSVDYTLAAAKACAESIAPFLDGRKFRFVFCSGDSTELDQSKKLWIMGPTRKVKGQAEKGLFDIADSHADIFESYTVRPCGIYPYKPTLKEKFLTTFVLPTLRVEELSSTMVDVCLNGYPGRIIIHDEIRKKGQAILSASADQKLES